MHVGVAHQRAKGPQQRSALHRVSPHMTGIGQALHHQRPGHGPGTNEFGVHGGQRHDAPAAQRAHTVKALHLQKALRACVQHAGAGGAHAGFGQRLQCQVLGQQQVAPAL